MLDHNLVLKSDEVFSAGEILGQQSGELAAGLYARDTRFLSRFHLTLDGKELETLSARALGATRAAVVQANPALTLAGGETIQPRTIAIEASIELSDGVDVHYVVQNFHTGPVTVTLAIEITADFRDLFAIRGFSPPPPGHLLQPAKAPRRIILGYIASDNLTARTIVELDRPCQIGAAAPASGAALLTVTPGFPLALEAGERWELHVRINLQPASGGPLSDVVMTPAALGMATVETGNGSFNDFINRSLSDLAMLQTSFPQGSLPAAGIPWFVAPFGRDSLIVALQTLHLAPTIAAGTLRVLAASQGTTEDPWREEQPGKILHEVRQGELARLKQVPHTPHYGSIDATPLFVLLFAETVAWTGDEVLYRELRPNAERAIAWIEHDGDLDGDGLVEYRSQPREGTRLQHQGWKDSFDSLNHTDGRPASGNIALVEVQGYVFAAYSRLAAVARQFGDTAWARQLEARAASMRATVEERFWLDDAGCYAQALDGDKTPVATISSNPGHLLYCGLPAADRAARLVHRLLEPDMDSGWGIRTLSGQMATYNPMSYHNGSVWPHDNSLILAGLRRYGYAAAANSLTAALFDAARTQPLTRLPELYCGFAREGERAAAPVDYPVSCSPQAWAAGAGPLLLRAMLGLEMDLARQRLIVDPALPPWLSEITVRDLRVLGQAASIEIRRSGTGYHIASTGPIEAAASAAAR